MERREYPRHDYQRLVGRVIAPGDPLGERMPYRSIEVERLPSIDRSPVDRLVLLRFGKAHYEGKRNVERIGCYTGRFLVNEFGKICYLIDALGIEGMRHSYRAYAKGRVSTVVRLVRADLTEKTIEASGEAGPIELWSVQRVIESVASGISWQASAPHTTGSAGWYVRDGKPD
jgi:hypothetical protein